VPEPDVVVIDYGMGNLFSVVSALRYLGADTTTATDPSEVAMARALILPGVGSFRRGMEELRRSGLDSAIRDAVARGTRLLGICLGMQLLGSSSTEDGTTLGLGLVDAVVESFPIESGFKVPHVGFSTVASPPESTLFRGLGERPSFYFVHSYRMPRTPTGSIASTCDYGGGFVASFEADNVAGAQFHPEKSQANGLVLLANFLRA